MTRLAIVGCEASGKTVFMSALADLYRDALTPENPAANRFARLAARQLRARREWPPATNPDRSAALDFALRANGRRLARFSLLEFGGETFRAAFRDDEGAPAHKSAVKRLLDYLADADFVAVLVSLKELLRDPGAVPMEDFERDTESLWVTRGLLEFVRAHLPRAGVVIGLTRADLYRAEIAAGGGAAALFARHWPSIRAVAPEVPVVPVASVSATDADGRPAEGFSTEGALTIMHEYLRQNSETPEQLLAELAGERTELETLKPAGSPTFYANKLRRFVAKLDRAEAAVVMSGRAPGEEIAALRRAADAFTQALRQTGPKPKPRKKKKKGGAGAPLRALLALLLLAAGGGALIALCPREARDAAGRRLRPLLDAIPRLAARQKPPERPRTLVITNILTEVRTVTNFVAQARAESSPAPAPKAKPREADAPSAAVATNAPPAAVATNAPSATAGAFRIWRDHRGTAIEARWTDTAADGKAITLETRGGKKIRAVLRKFSDEDRAFVESELRR